MCWHTRRNQISVSAKRTSPFKSAGASVHSTAGSRGVRISGSNAGYNMFRVGVKGTGFLLHSPVSPSLPLPCVTVCHHISTGVYTRAARSSVTVPTTLSRLLFSLGINAYTHEALAFELWQCNNYKHNSRERNNPG